MAKYHLFAAAVFAAVLSSCVTPAELDIVDRGVIQVQEDVNNVRNQVNSLQLSYQETIAWRGSISDNFADLQKQFIAVNERANLAAENAAKTTAETLNKFREEVIGPLTTSVSNMQTRLDENLEAIGARLDALEAGHAQTNAQLTQFKASSDEEFARINRVMLNTDLDALRLQWVQLQLDQLGPERTAIEQRERELARERDRLLEATSNRQNSGATGGGR
ncbi:MAG: hypothetical protein NUW37_09380 [Planctomycetes bacterium]|nr:hypothetical protein [Planctomycetota bacterium]